MKRFFIEVAYIGTHYSGFQIQKNAITIQGEIENALFIIFKQQIQLTGSSRTDAGVHAKQNFFHLDVEENFLGTRVKSLKEYAYNLNALLPNDIVIKTIKEVQMSAHSRFSATARSYIYTLGAQKNPFTQHTSYYFPYPLDIKLLNEAADIVREQTCFEAFSKKHSQVHNFNCTIYESEWHQAEDGLSMAYYITGNRFLRGMVKALTGTMLRLGTGSISMEAFQSIFTHKHQKLVDFSPPGKGLTLVSVVYPEEVFL